MLILSRQLSQSITAGPVTVQAIHGDTVQLLVEGGAARLGPEVLTQRQLAERFPLGDEETQRRVA